MKTTIDLPDALYRSVHDFAAAENTPLPEMIAALVKRALSEKPLEPKAEEDFQEWRAELL